MANKAFLDLTGLNTFLNQLKELFATQASVDNVEQDTNTYVLNVDYAALEFDTSEIVS